MRTLCNDLDVPLYPQFHYVLSGFYRSIMYACGHNGTTAVSRYVHVWVETFVTSRCVRRPVMSAKYFYHSIVSVCGHFGTTATSHFVHCSIMSAKILYCSVVSVCRHFGTTATFHCVNHSIMSAGLLSFHCVRIRILRNDCCAALCPWWGGHVSHYGILLYTHNYNYRTFFFI